MNNKGFIATSLIYSFFLLFIAVLAAILNGFLSNNKILNRYNESVQDKINQQIEEKEKIPLYVQEVLDKLKIKTSYSKTTFGSIATTYEGTFTTKDNTGISFYYRGNINDNYVLFGKTESGESILWRILRVNGNGTLRLIYDSTSETNDQIVSTKWSLTTENSNLIDEDNQVRNKLNEWYENIFVGTEYEDFISDEIFCSDFSELNDESSTTTYSTKYSSLLRDLTPNLICNEEYVYTVSNNKLTYPIGLISADEVIFAGGNYNYQNSNYYLKRNYPYWTLTLFNRYLNTDLRLFGVDTDGKLSNFSYEDEISLLPVINLKKEYVLGFSGNGTITDPYVGNID